VTAPRQTPEWLVERLAAGELSEDDAAQVRARLEAEGRSPAEVLGGARGLEPADPAGRAAGAHGGAHPGARAAAGARRVAGRRAGVRGRHRGAGGGGDAQSRSRWPTWGAARSGGTTVKGPSRLVVYRQTAGTPERLHDGSKAEAGDTFRWPT
jgi:hypothetical protein